MPHRDREVNLSYICAVAVSLLALYLSSLHSYILFHSLVELATIAIAFTLFMLAWNTQRFQANGFLGVLGCGYACIALIDLLHTLSYRGMNLFPGHGANLPTQLWIAARTLQALTLCAAPFFVARRTDNRLLFLIFGALASSAVALIYSGRFPDCYREGEGLTPFKTGSEYLIIALLLGSMQLLYSKRAHFKGSVLLLVLSSTAVTALSELLFASYLRVDGPGNMAGHFFKLAAFYLIYRAILVTGLREPFDLIFKELKDAQQALGKSHQLLEEKVRVRSEELRAREEKYHALIECANDAVFIQELGADGMPARFIEVNGLACARLGYSREELARICPQEIEDPRHRELAARVMERLQRDRRALFETAQLTKEGRSIPVEVSASLLELNGERLLFSLVRDISERKLAEKQRQEIQEKLVEAQRIAQIGYWDRDFVLNRITLADEACRIFGIPSREAVFDLEAWRQRWLALIHPEDRCRANQAFLDALQGGKSYAVEYRIVRADGEVRQLHSEASLMRDRGGKPLRMLGMVQDVTAQKRAEDALRKLTEELERRVRERTAELEQKNAELKEMNRLFVGRELRMVELKERIRELEGLSRSEQPR